MASLPVSFALKSSFNNKYLACKQDEGKSPLTFSEDDVSTLTALEVVDSKSGTEFVNLKLINKFLTGWSKNRYSIAAEADKPEEQKSEPTCTLFEVKVVDEKAKTIKLIWQNKKKKDLSHEPFSHVLSSAVETEELKDLDVFTITSLVPVKREITGIIFHLDKAKIIGETPIENLARGVAINNQKSNESIEVKLEYSDVESGKESLTWTSGQHSQDYSHTVTNLTSAIPVLVNGTFLLSGDNFNGSLEWGKPLETIKTVKTTYKVVVPPITKAIVTLKAKRVKFEVPFSFKQDDTLEGGKKLSYAKDDGIFTREIIVNYEYHTRDEQPNK